MVQGNFRGNKSKRSSGASKKQKIKAAKRATKGWKTHKPKGRKAAEGKSDVSVSKAISKKNELLISAKAISHGSRFFLNDLKENGQKALEKGNKAKLKKEAKDHKKSHVTDRIKEQLKKI